jgi:hypothetical protein
LVLLLVGLALALPVALALGTCDGELLGDTPALGLPVGR